MIQKLYAVYDSVAKVYMPPFLSQNDGAARRMFAQAVNSKGHQLNTNASDFFLHCLGEFDDSTGKITPQNPELVCSAVAMLVPNGPDRNQLDLIDNPRNQGMN